MRRLLPWAAPWLATLVLLAGVEAAVRWTLPHEGALEALVADPHGLRNLLGAEEKRDGPGRVRTFEADPLLFWRLSPNLDAVIWASTLVSTNAQGIRYPRDVGPKPEGGFRVLCFGDSVTFGYQIPLVLRDRPEAYDRDARAYPAALEARLRRRLTDRTVEVLPLAVPGYTSHQGRAWMERDLDALEADAVIVAFGWNDADLRAATDRAAMPGGWVHRLSRRVVLSSQALIHAAGWLRRARPGGGTAGDATPRVPREAFVENHLAMAALAKERGVPLLVIGPVYRDAVTDPDAARRVGAHREALAEAMSAAGVAYLQVPALTEAGHPHNAALFLEEVHPSALGQERLAEEIERRLVEAGMLPAAGPVSGRAQ